MFRMAVLALLAMALLTTTSTANAQVLYGSIVGNVIPWPKLIPVPSE